MSTRRPWKFRTAPTTAILDQPDVVRQESWHTSAFRLESRLSTSSSVQNIIGSSMGPSGEGLAIGFDPDRVLVTTPGGCEENGSCSDNFQNSCRRDEKIGPGNNGWNHLNQIRATFAPVGRSR
jgi:hypothetical protein